MSQDKVGRALDEQPDLVVRRRRKGQQRRRAQLLEMYLAVHMRKEVDRYPCAYTLFIAEQEDLLELGQPVAAHGENDLVDDLAAQQLPEIRNRQDVIFRAQPDLLFGLVCLGQKSQQPDSILRRALQFLSKSPRAFADSDYH